jgi:HJR/Mrr/RecB family endonuclease
MARRRKSKIGFDINDWRIKTRTARTPVVGRIAKRKRLARKSMKGYVKVDSTLLVVVFVVLIVLIFLAFVVSLFRDTNTLGRSILILLVIGIPTIYVFFKLRRRWLRTQQLRALHLADIDTMPGHTFEHYIAQIMEHQGYKTSVTKGSGDLGVDIIAQRDNVRYAVQCKRYDSNIPRTAISDAVAGKQHYGCTHAMVVTNQYFTSGAVELATSTQCIMVDRMTLASWVAQFQQQQK